MSTPITNTSNSEAQNRNSNFNVFNKNPMTDAVIWEPLEQQAVLAGIT